MLLYQPFLFLRRQQNNPFFFIVLLSFICVFVSACVNSDKKGKQHKQKKCSGSLTVYSLAKNIKRWVWLQKPQRTSKKNFTRREHLTRNKLFNKCHLTERLLLSLFPVVCRKFDFGYGVFIQ